MDCFTEAKEYSLIKKKHWRMQTIYFRMPYFQQIDRFKVPEWARQNDLGIKYFLNALRMVIQQMILKGRLPWGSKDPDREDFFGGDLQRVVDHLDYLADWESQGIYFCPVFGSNLESQI